MAYDGEFREESPARTREASRSMRVGSDEIESGNCRASLRDATETILRRIESLLAVASAQRKLSEIWNQEARKTGGDQEFLETPGLKAWPLLRIRCSMASRLNLILPSLSDHSAWTEAGSDFATRRKSSSKISMSRKVVR